jgi:aminopeptidase N
MGDVTIRFTLKAARQVVLDFEQPRDHLKSVNVNDAAVDAVFANGHVVIPSSATKAGENSVAISFIPGDESLNRSDDFLLHAVRPRSGEAGVSALRSA